MSNFFVLGGVERVFDPLLFVVVAQGLHAAREADGVTDEPAGRRVAGRDLALPAVIHVDGVVTKPGAGAEITARGRGERRKDGSVKGSPWATVPQSDVLCY